MASQERITRTCGRCGATQSCPHEGLPEGWSFSTEGGRVEYLCVACARANLRAIEGRLPQEYWEF